jgi:hypothetical protein
MIVKTLPDYSAERYYLLSEIEQKSKFIFLEDDSSKEGETTVTANVCTNPLAMYYIRWQPVTESKEQVCEKFHHLLKEAPPAKHASIILVIEAFIQTRNQWTAALQQDIQLCTQWLEKQFHTEQVIVGITDSVGGTPALEKCHDMIESLVPGYEDFIIIVDFIAKQRIELLGNDPSLEPDAQSDVFQLLCLPNEEITKKFENEIKVKLKEFVTSKSLKVNKKTSSVNMILIVIFSIVVIIFAYLYNKK